ncbi:MAG: hypothetical protein OXC92_00655 [Flavobacteriaceae bacterium]|nr:hypothetical protein [Flavobacteriaceae bacterium]
MRKTFHLYADPYNLDETYLRDIRLPKSGLVNNETYWVRTGEKVIFSGLDIKHGFFYLGKKLLVPNKKILDPALINPQLDVLFVHTHNIDEHEFDDKQGYADLIPEARGDYL